MTQFAEDREYAAREKDFERQEAEKLPCPECQAPVGERCRNVHDGQPLGRFPAHWRRIKAAREVEP